MPPSLLHLIQDPEHLLETLNQSAAGAPQPLIAFNLAFDFKKGAPGNNPQPRPSSLAGTQDHAAVQLTAAALASGFSALAFEFIDSALDHRLIGEERPGTLSYLVAELAE